MYFEFSKAKKWVVHHHWFDSGCWDMAKAIERLIMKRTLKVEAYCFIMQLVSIWGHISWLSNLDQYIQINCSWWKKTPILVTWDWVLEVKTVDALTTMILNAPGLYGGLSKQAIQEKSVTFGMDGVSTFQGNQLMNNHSSLIKLHEPCCTNIIRFPHGQDFGEVPCITLHICQNFTLAYTEFPKFCSMFGVKGEQDLGLAKHVLEKYRSSSPSLRLILHKDLMKERTCNNLSHERISLPYLAYCNCCSQWSSFMLKMNA